MNKEKNVLQEMITVQKNENDEVVISGRELHEFLEIGTQYTKWMERMLGYGFVENTDFYLDSQKRLSSNVTGYKVVTDHILKLDMAKEISMIQRTDKGKQARQYFIEIEKKYRAYNSQSEEEFIEKAFIMATKRLEQKDKEIELLESKLSHSEVQHYLNKSNVKLAEMLRGGELKLFMTLDEFVQELYQKGYKIGMDTFYSWLKLKGLIYRNGYFRPTSKANKLELFHISRKCNMIDSVDGDKIIGITSKGFCYLADRITKDLKEIEHRNNVNSEFYRREARRIFDSI